MKTVLFFILVLGFFDLVVVPVASATPMVDPLKGSCIAPVSVSDTTVVYDSARNVFALVRGGKVVGIAAYVPGKKFELGGEAVQIFFHAYYGGKIDYSNPRTWRMGEKTGAIAYGQLCQ